MRIVTIAGGGGMGTQNTEFERLNLFLISIQKLPNLVTFPKIYWEFSNWYEMSLFIKSHVGHYDTFHERLDCTVFPCALNF